MVPSSIKQPSDCEVGLEVGMCGIFATVSREKAPVAEQTLTGLKTLEYRGYDSWGVAWLEGSSASSGWKVTLEKSVGKIGQSELKTAHLSLAAIGHTRWATHGGVTAKNAHPHLDCTGTLAVVHNGIVENYQQLKAELDAKNHTWRSETDTEVIVHMLEEALDVQPLPEAVRTVFNRLTGLNALVVLNAKTQQVVAIRHGSPLIIAQNDEQFLLASDSVAVIPYSTKVHFLKNEELVVFSSTGLELFNSDGQKIAPEWETLPFTENQVSQGKFPNFLLKEVHEQPAVLTSVLAQENEIREFTDGLSEALLFIGCGTAYNAGVFAAYIWAKLANRRSQYVVGSEMENWQATITDQTQPIFISQSGETIDLIESALYLKSRNIPITAIVNRLGSTLHRLADRSLILPAGPEMCVLATKSFTAKIATFLLAAAIAGGKLEQAKNDFQRAIEGLATILEPSFGEKYLQPLAAQLAHHQHIFVLGRGLSYSIALEAAMKIKEVTYIHVEGVAAGELKHGTIALIEKGTPCLVIAPKDETWPSMISGAMEVKARGAFVIGVSPVNDTAFDCHIPVPEAGLATAIGQTVAMQLLAYEIATLLGNDIDKPRNLAKSVTVK